MRLSSLKQTSERKFTYLTSPTKFFNSMCVKITPDISHMVGNYWNVYYHFISISKIKKFLMKIDNDYLWHSIWLTNDKQWNNFVFGRREREQKELLKFHTASKLIYSWWLKYLFTFHIRVLIYCMLTAATTHFIMIYQFRIYDNWTCGINSLKRSLAVGWQQNNKKKIKLWGNLWLLQWLRRH